MRQVPLLLLALLVISACGSEAPPTDSGGGGGGGGGAGGTSDTVIAAFKAAGLEAENQRAMTQDDYGKAPFLCSGTQFSLPSLGADKAGHLFICDLREQMTSLKTYFNVRSQGNPELRSWTFSKGTVLLQIDGSMPHDKAQKYEAALP